MNSRLKKLTKCQSFWPLMVLLAILLVNGVVSGGAFFQMRIVDGHLYGRLIDILRNGSKLMLLATGMTMVLATGGTDISVGSVMAISGAIACSSSTGASCRRSAAASRPPCSSRCSRASSAARGTGCSSPRSRSSRSSPR